MNHLRLLLLLAQVQSSVLFMLQRPDVYAEVRSRTRVRPGEACGRAVLFDGPPGTGKTTTARILASKLDLPMIILTADNIHDKYFGESEKRMRKIFNAAEAMGGAVIFIDEADAFAVDRDASHDSTRSVLTNVRVGVRCVLSAFCGHVCVGAPGGGLRASSAVASVHRGTTSLGDLAAAAFPAAAIPGWLQHRDEIGGRVCDESVRSCIVACLLQARTTTVPRAWTHLGHRLAGSKTWTGRACHMLSLLFTVVAPAGAAATAAAVLAAAAAAAPMLLRLLLLLLLLLLLIPACTARSLAPPPGRSCRGSRV
jgi:SpoVK/Ycf46/Vps4 family AAA+-type ATPase